MSKKDYYIIEKNINRINNNIPSYFLDPPTLLAVKKKIKGSNYNIYYPYKDADRCIIYKDKLPNVKVIEIISYDKLTHREIMGSLFGTNISYELFGDIIIMDNHYYIVVLDEAVDYLYKYLSMIGTHHIKINTLDLSVLDNYERKYEEIEIIASSLRIDTVISRIINSSRDKIKTKFIDGDIILNYEVIHKINLNLNVGDIFSIRKFGKFKFDRIKGFSKSNNYIIIIKKYVDN